MKHIHSDSIPVTPRALSFARCGLALAGAVALAASMSVARADAWDKKTTVSFSQPVEVPGYILQPGKYVMKLVDSQSNRHVVQFLNERQNRVYATALAIPAYRTQVTGHTVITFYEAAAGQPEPIRYWYYPGDNFGQEFMYPKEHLREIALAIHPAAPPVVEARREAEPSPVATAEPVPEGELAPVGPVETQAQADSLTNDESNAPVEIAQATRPKPDESVTAPPPPPEPTELPKTDGNFAGIAMLGLVSIGGAITARKLRRF